MFFRNMIGISSIRLLLFYFGEHRTIFLVKARASAGLFYLVSLLMKSEYVNVERSFSYFFTEISEILLKS